MLKNLFGICATTSILVLFAVTFLLPVFSASAADYVPLAPIPGTTATNGSGTNLSTYLTGMFKVGIAVAGVLTFLMIVWGGFTYLSTDAIMGKEEGKERIQRALGGLVLALGAYIILNTINPQLVNLNLNFGPVANRAPTIGPPAELISVNTTSQMQDLEALRSESRGVISNNVNQRIQALNAREADGLTPEEETEAQQLNIIRNGTTALNYVDIARTNALAEIAKNGFVPTNAGNAQRIIDAVNQKLTVQLEAMARDGATAGQLKIVQDRYKQVADAVKQCVDKYRASGKVAVGCQQ